MLDSRRLPGGPHWYVIRSHHRQESRADANLRSGGIETFLPWVRPPSGGRTRPQEPLFPQYLFARFDPVVSLHDVTFTRGVQSVVRVGGQLATVDDVIEFFRALTDEHGCVPLARKLEPGERVMVEGGPFAELAGIVERNLPARQRVVVLLTSVDCQVRIELSADHVQANGFTYAS